MKTEIIATGELPKPEIKWPALFLHKDGVLLCLKFAPGKTPFIWLRDEYNSILYAKEDNCGQVFEENDHWEYVSKPITITFTP